MGAMAPPRELEASPWCGMQAQAHARTNEQVEQGMIVRQPDQPKASGAAQEGNLRHALPYPPKSFSLVCVGVALDIVRGCFAGGQVGADLPGGANRIALSEALSRGADIPRSRGLLGLGRARRQQQEKRDSQRSSGRYRHRDPRLEWDSAAARKRAAGGPRTPVRLPDAANTGLRAPSRGEAPGDRRFLPALLPCRCSGRWFGTTSNLFVVLEIVPDGEAEPITCHRVSCGLSLHEEAPVPGKVDASQREASEADPIDWGIARCAVNPGQASQKSRSEVEDGYP